MEEAGEGLLALVLEREVLACLEYLHEVEKMGLV